MEERSTLRRATDLWQEAYRYQIEGELDRAIELYQHSIEVYPTAEAHTFLGWAMSFQGRLAEATQECLRAIEIDAEFGNPYNDIGVYLLQQDSTRSGWPRRVSSRRSAARVTRKTTRWRSPCSGCSSREAFIGAGRRG